MAWDVLFRLGSFGVRQMSPHARIDAAGQMVDALVYVNRLWLPFHPETPPLYQSGVVFAADGSELDGSPNLWADIPATIAVGSGHCVALAAWRLAELREAGERARVRIFEWKMPEGTHFHIHLLRANGTIEDPAKVLGMP